METLPIQPRFRTVRFFSFKCPVCETEVRVTDPPKVEGVRGGCSMMVRCPDCEHDHHVAKHRIIEPGMSVGELEQRQKLRGKFLKGEVGGVA